MSEHEASFPHQGTRVTFLDQTGAKSVEAVIAEGVTVKRILPNVVTKMNLPVMGPDGQPMSYSLDHKEGGKRLLEGETLVEAGVHDGDHLIVYPEIVAGSGQAGVPRGHHASPSGQVSSPRLRRLRNDHLGLTRLAEESTIFSFLAGRGMHRDAPPESYVVRFLGRGLERDSSGGRVQLRGVHEVSIQLGAGYPRMIPVLFWRTPIFHPNISAGGTVCLGGYSTHWVPSLQLDQLCIMLWDMIRYVNYDIQSPYNREAAAWVREQRDWTFPLDPRHLRDRGVRRTETASGSVVIQRARPADVAGAASTSPAELASGSVDLGPRGASPATVLAAADRPTTTLPPEPTRPRRDPFPAPEIVFLDN